MISPFSHFVNARAKEGDNHSVLTGANVSVVALLSDCSKSPL